LLNTLASHLGPVYVVCFAPNGRYLVAAGQAGRLQFWDLQRGETFAYTAEELLKEFHAPQAVREVLAPYNLPLAPTC